MNEGIADVDDELAEVAARLAWLARAPTWLNQRTLEEFDSFVTAKLAECEASLAAVRARWEKHQAEQRPAASSSQET